MSERGGGQVDALTTAELRRLAKREQEKQQKRRQRARKATDHAKAALAPNPTGYVVPEMPAGLSAIRKWVRQAHDAYSRRQIGPFELTEIRRSASSIGDLYRAGSEIRKAEAALRAAQAQERMAEALAAVEHGGTALVMLARLQESLTDGKRRPLPGRVHALTASSEPAS
jgi:vacuolar-type H+-ATPase subunit I/STV1